MVERLVVLCIPKLQITRGPKENYSPSPPPQHQNRKHVDIKPRSRPYHWQFAVLSVMAFFDVIICVGPTMYSVRACTNQCVALRMECPVCGKSLVNLNVSLPVDFRPAVAVRRRNKYDDSGLWWMVAFWVVIALITVECAEQISRNSSRMSPRRIVISCHLLWQFISLRFQLLPENVAMHKTFFRNFLMERFFVIFALIFLIWQFNRNSLDFFHYSTLILSSWDFCYELWPETWCEIHESSSSTPEGSGRKIYRKSSCNRRIHTYDRKWATYWRRSQPPFQISGPLGHYRSPLNFHST